MQALVFAERAKRDQGGIQSLYIKDGHYDHAKTDWPWTPNCKASVKYCFEYCVSQPEDTIFGKECGVLAWVQSSEY